MKTLRSTLWMQRALICLAVCALCLALPGACVKKHPDWQGFQGTPVHGAPAWQAEVRTSNIRSGAAQGAGKLFVEGRNLRYEENNNSPFGRLVLLARLDSGKAWLLNPANMACLESSFNPQHWVELAHIFESFPQLAVIRRTVKSEELLGAENLGDYKVNKLQRLLEENAFGETRTQMQTLWLAEEFCVPLRIETGETRQELVQISTGPLAATLFALPSTVKMVSGIDELVIKP